jgi:hypothetical protein
MRSSGPPLLHERCDLLGRLLRLGLEAPEIGFEASQLALVLFDELLDAFALFDCELRQFLGAEALASLFLGLRPGRLRSSLVFRHLGVESGNFILEGCGLVRWRRRRDKWTECATALIDSTRIPDGKVPSDFELLEGLRSIAVEIVRCTVTCFPKRVEELSDFCSEQLPVFEILKQSGLVPPRLIESGPSGQLLSHHLAELTELHQARVRIKKKEVLREVPKTGQYRLVLRQEGEV